MMKYRFLFPLCIVFVWLCCACSDDGTESAPACSVAQERYEISSDGGLVTISVRATVDYEVTLPEGVDWISETEPSAAEEHCFSVAPNRGYEPRSVTVTFSNTRCSILNRVVISQAQTDALFVEDDRVEVGPAGGVIAVDVSSNIGCTASVSAEGRSWITPVASGTRVFETYVLRFSVSANRTGEAREAVVTVTSSDGAVSREVTVVQSESLGYVTPYETFVGDWVLTGTSTESGERASALIRVREKEAGVSYTVEGWICSTLAPSYPVEMLYEPDTGTISVSGGQRLGTDSYGYTVTLAGFVPGSSWTLDYSDRILFRGEPEGEDLVRFVPQSASTGLNWMLLDSSGAWYYYDDYTAEDLSWERRTVEEQYYTDGQVIRYQTHTRGDGVNLIFTGDGYTALYDMGRDGTWYTDLAEAAEGYFEIEPYASLRDYFDIYFIAAESAEEGATVLSDGITRNTVFSSVLAGGGSTNISCDYDMVLSYVSTYLEMDWSDIYKSAIVVLINLDRYAGTCYTNITFSTGNAYNIAMCPVNRSSSFINTVWHESGGHGWGRLADEYCSYEETAPSSTRKERERWMQHGFFQNISFESREEVSWADYFDRPDYTMVGYYEGAAYYLYGIWRPEISSCMLDNRGYFNTPSREAIYRRTIEQSGGTFSIDEFLEYDRINIQAGLDNLESGSTAYSASHRMLPQLGRSVYEISLEPERLRSVSELRHSRLHEGGGK